MLRGKIIDKLEDISDAVAVNQSRCTRMRYNGSLCNMCLKSCNANALRIDGGLHIDKDSCSECMVCVSVCPSGAFGIAGLNIYSVIARLGKVSRPVLGCDKAPGVKAHEKTFCPGFLSEQLIIALSFFLKKPLQINLTKCSDCRNGFIVDVLRERLESIREKTPPEVSGRMKLVYDSSDLEYQEVSFDRRGFFRAMKDITVRNTARLFDDADMSGDAGVYSVKKPSFQMELLNRVIKSDSEDLSGALLKNYYYNITTDETCNDCFACVGMCPSGALKTGSDGSDSLVFSASLCTGCGLCSDFCMNNSIQLKKGFPGHDPFEFCSVKEGLFCSS